MDDLLDNGHETMHFRRGGGGPLVIEAVYRPGAPRPPAGFHPEQTELVEVLSGAVAVTLDGEMHTVRAGEKLRIPPRVRHSVACAGSEEAHTLLTLDPPLETEAFFRETFAFVRARGLKMTPGNLVRYAALARRFKREFMLAKPPPALQTALFSLLAPLGRLLGYT
jgi:mannose-6-phosphate isomerase-like protein (cupin superfamily)